MFGKIIFLLCSSFGLSTLAPRQQHTTVARLHSYDLQSGARYTNLCSNSSRVYFCENPTTYPVAAIKRAMTSQTKMHRMFKKENNTLPKKCLKRSAKDYYPACPSTEQIFLPRVGTNTSKKQRYLVNRLFNQQFQQSVRVTICDTEYRESCGANIFTGVKTWCKQEFSKQQLVAYDIERDKLVLEPFIFPSSCSCMIDHSNNSN